MRGFAILAFLIMPMVSFASVSINEVMYDLEGTDTDREWLELKNVGSESINLSSWKFYENNSNHGLTVYSGDESISPGGFAVIVDSPETFLADWPSFSGNLFDSSWSSFSNTGESFSIKNEDGDVVDEFTYVPEDGAGGDGNSLQVLGGEIVPASPTPGEENQGSIQESGGGEDQNSDQSTETEEETPKTFNTFVIPDRVVSGEKIKFEPKLYDNEGELMFKELFIWSLGDGVTREDEYRKDFYHTYEYPGSYVAYVEVYEGGRLKEEPDHVYRQTIQVIEANVGLSIISGGVLIKNKSVYELNLGDWDLVFGKDKFRIPKNTIVLPGKEIIFSKRVLGVDGISSVLLQNEVDFMVSSVNLPEEKPAQAKTKIIYAQPKSASSGAIRENSRMEQEPAEKVVEETSVEPESQVASAASVASKTNKSLWIWVYIVLIGGVIVSVGYFYFKEDEMTEEKSEADDYTFVD